MKYIYLCIVSLLSFHIQAKTVNCTKAQKSEANGMLLSISEDNQIQSQLAQYHLPFGLPANTSLDNQEQILYQGGYVLAYDNDLKTGLWVSYVLKKDDILGAKQKNRVNCFRDDPRITDGPTPKDFKEPIFDQGHLANDADLKDNEIHQINSYMMTNMSPQHCRFNRGVWLSLEHLTRQWAFEYETVYVTSGAVFDRNSDGQRDHDNDAIRMLSNSKQSRVAVPSHYYKIISRINKLRQFESIAFLLPHDNISHGVKWSEVYPYAQARVVSIEQIEQLSGFKFFPQIDRHYIKQSADGLSWDLAEGKKSNMEYSCK